MATTEGPKIVKDNLVFYYDTMNVKSYKGEPTTNILPSPTINGYPTIGNAWGTYNINQYNGGAYFSISAIVSVVGNLVTTTTAHGMRTYDVMNPQSTGGGVTASVNYFVKAVSTTSFTLHQYNDSQDGSQGYTNPTTGTYKVYDSIATDTRISVNATSFPTMWWGYPHLPNSGLVKEVIAGGYTIDKYTKTDCLRLHWHRADGVTDGMAYGVDVTVTPSSVYTVSFWTRAVSSTAVGKTINYQIYNYTGGSNTGFNYYPVLGAVGVWEKKSFTFTPLYGTCVSYWFPGTGPYHCDIANIQFELKSHATPFTTGTRSNTNSLLPLVINPVANVTIDLTSVSFNSNAEITFDGVNDVIALGTGNTFFPLYNFTLETWVKCSGMGASMSLGGLFAITYGLSLHINSDGNLRCHVDDGVSTFTYLITSGISLFSNTWRHVVFTNNGSSSYLYVDGVFINSTAAPWSGITRWPTNEVYLGRDNNNSDYFLLGSLALPKIYNKCLTSTEVLQNYTSEKNKVGAETTYKNAYEIKLANPSATSGLYTIVNTDINSGKPTQIYADMTTDGGGWTLIMTNSDTNGWSYANAINRNSTSPSISSPYSIIGFADALKRSQSGFQYMIDSNARGTYGGIWTANSNYSFTSSSNTNTNITLNIKFSTWEYADDSIEARMPYYSNSSGIVTTSNDANSNWWGTLITNGGWTPAPWMNAAGMGSPGIIWYWVR